ncbi:peptide ABC transporter substrate-binding protein [Acetobacter syzygii]|uniref:ABC transporter substrate-binding protein n=1 Tax=Acetobacter syzygii TaxID=146476 RepID=UPI0005DE39A8|nr:ABC transporter substrate-binding protein [Acetobacter syzygii]GAN71310.1 ABC transporter oligopeptide permease [Acetobacter syzygii]GBR63368.1 peptide ABC transporter substrate-binding protein [Acetobacter syzygii NRIC 0483]GEL55192.1 peptide ABC transporter substrate-binding protein [Acetobacter syzygii]
MRTIKALTRFCMLAGTGLICCAQPAWSAPLQAPHLPDHAGGTLRLVAAASGGTLDPQINYTGKYINLFANVYDGLTTFRKIPGPNGKDVVPDLAEALPTPQDGGLTYSFTLRPNIHFSNGQPVTTADVVASFQRLFKVGSPTAGAFYGAIVGADTCLRTPSRCTLEHGVEADAGTRRITFHLTHPDTEFLQKLAFTHAVILPASTPDHDTGNTPLPGTGPYRLEAYDPNNFLTLARNPAFYVWNPDAQPAGYPDRIEYTFGIPEEAAVTAVENGQYDWMADPVPLDRLGELGSRFIGQTHVMRYASLYFLPMNMHEAPFTDVRVRQAVNYALNRKALVILYGGPGIAHPLCGLVPSVLQVSGQTCPYTRGASVAVPAQRWTAPDMTIARQLVRESGTAGQKVTLVVANTSTEMAMGVWIRDMLQSLGYQAALRPLSSSLHLAYIQNTDNHVQIALTGWSADYPSPSNFLDALFGCENFHPHSDSSINIPGFCDPHTQSVMDRAKTDVSLSTEQRNQLWVEANRLIMEQAAAAPLMEKDNVVLTSTRVKNFFYTDVNQLLFSQVWLH